MAKPDKTPKPAKRDDIRERIVQATITCIERMGFDATGVRDIAQEANVNGAAINYYFGSKDNLLAAALERTLDEGLSNVLEDFDKLTAEGHGPRRAFEILFEELLGHNLVYPRIAYAHMHASLSEQRYDTPAMDRLKEFIDGLTSRLRTAKPLRSEVQLRSAITQVWSVLLYAALLPRFYDRAGSLDLSQPDVRKVFITQLVQIIVPEDDKADEPRRSVRR